MRGTTSLYVIYGCWKKRSTLIATPHINSSRTKLLFITSMYSTMSLLNTYGATFAISNTTSSLSKMGFESCFRRTSVEWVGNFSADPNLNLRKTSCRARLSPRVSCFLISTPSMHLIVNLPPAFPMLTAAAFASGGGRGTRPPRLVPRADSSSSAGTSSGNAVFVRARETLEVLREIGDAGACVLSIACEKVTDL